MLCDSCHELRTLRLEMAMRKAYREASPELIHVVDSWEEPTAAQVAAAKGAGYGAWLGYFKESATDRIYHGWQDSTFELVKAGGLLTGDYCSQLDDPTWVRNRAASLGIIAILDDESGIDPDNAGTDAWLAAAGAHIYGGSGVQAAHRTHSHLGYVFSEYPAAGNPSGLNWPNGFAVPDPPRPMGWQYSDKGSVGGLSVDLSVFDPAIFGAAPPKPKEEQEMFIANDGVKTWLCFGGVKVWIPSQASLAAIQAGTPVPPNFGNVADMLALIPVAGSGGSGSGPLTLAGTIEDQGGGKSSLTGTVG